MQKADEETLAGFGLISIRSPSKTSSRDHASRSIAEPSRRIDDDDSDSTLLTMRQLRDRIRAEEAAAQPTEPEDRHERDPLHWLLQVVFISVSPNKPK